MSDQARHLHHLTTPRAMSLLSGATFGRMVFSHRALPAVRLVTHIVDEDDVIIRVGSGTLPPLALVLTFEADEIDASTRLGWCVVVTGMAEWVADSDEILRYEKLLPPWTSDDTDQLLRIQAQFVEGYELLESSVAA